MCVAGVALSMVGVAGASASDAAPRPGQAVRVSPAGTSLAAANPGAQLWATRYNGTGNNADVATSVAVSPTGRTVYVTGQSYGTASVVDYATVAYDAATGTRQWVARYNGPASSLSNVPSSVAVSPDGKTVFVTGKSQVSQFNDYATVAYDAATGHQLWAKGYNGPLNNDDEATSVAASPTSGTVYVTGFSWGNGTAADYATIAYNATTGAQQWVKRYNGPPGNGNDEATSMAVSPAGTVYVTGESGGTTSGGDYATVAYTAAGTQLWVKRYTFPGGNTDDARSVAVSPDGKTVYVTGQSWSQASAWDYATVAYDSASGAQRWVTRYNGPGSAYDLASSVAVSPTSGMVYVTGQSAGTSTGADYATIAYSATTGAQQWVARYNDSGNGTDIATSMAVSPISGTVYVTGQSQPGEEYATVAYNAAGTQQWAKRYSGSELYPSSVAVSPTTGTVFITGHIVRFGDYITIAYQG
jgi:DNA-binding beta-propeller fold protein YncE